jgi:hypothetical protein
VKVWGVYGKDDQEIADVSRGLLDLAIGKKEVFAAGIQSTLGDENKGSIEVRANCSVKPILKLVPLVGKHLDWSGVDLGARYWQGYGEGLLSTNFKSTGYGLALTVSP